MAVEGRLPIEGKEDADEYGRDDDVDALERVVPGCGVIAEA